MGRGAGTEQALAALAAQTGRAPFIVIAGNVGVGKTTLARALAEELAIALYEEPFEQNEFLERAYADPVRWRFESDKFFLEAAAEIHARCAGGGGIQDRGIIENWEVFAHDHRAQGWLTAEQLAELEKIYIAARSLPAPDLCVYLRSSPELAHARLRERNREIEAAVDPAFLSGLHDGLERMIAGWQAGPVMIIEPFELDDLPMIVQAICARLGRRVAVGIAV